ncbi:diguanylate cyclase domain-containing protein [Echinimonas agarilytica]|uniref:Diguanylate cyclase n=1 Tax=Echinimonas agarilytica TaxID=1215918 RepID=A0AA41W602_9GAMM|nr:diguanylate cyclase [Echinimonas agarilytica]MCM2679560.1 diguanylate cyclase [Echinimonas agarilytica]
MSNEICGNYQWPLFNALKEQARIFDIDLVVFEGRCIDSTLYQDKQHNLAFEFIDEDRLDGLIVCSGSLLGFMNEEDRNRWFLNRFHIPVVSLNLRFDGATNILLDDSVGMVEVVDHLIRLHHFKNLAFISGAHSSPEAKARLKAFNSVVHERDVKHHIIEGDFTPASGIRAAKTLIELHNNEAIDAAVFSNDDMAIAAIDYLHRHAPEIGNSIAITGFDNSPNSFFVRPSLTTVGQPFDEIARQSFEELKLQAKERQPPMDILLTTKPVYRRSCGCKPLDDVESSTQTQFFSIAYKVQEMIQSYKVDELLEQLAITLPHFKIKSCYIALYDKDDESNQQALAEHSSLIFAYQDNQRVPLATPTPFSTKELFPNPFWSSERQQDLILKPLFFNDNHFGFIVFDASVGRLEDMENIRCLVAQALNAALLFEAKAAATVKMKSTLLALKSANSELHALNKKLESISIRDELTQLYNRRGFFELVESYAVSSREPRDCLIFYTDINYLKMINDTYGHQTGDQAICLIANVLRESFREEDIIGRIGGDEFIICAKRCDESDIDTLIQRFASALKKYNKASGMPFEISAAIGFAAYHGGGKERLKIALDEADKRLYENKTESKKKYRLDAFQ